MSQTALSHEEITPFEWKEPLAPYTAAMLEGACFCRNAAASPQETMVFPTPVSVPVTKKLLICLYSALF